MPLVEYIRKVAVFGQDSTKVSYSYQLLSYYVQRYDIYAMINIDYCISYQGFGGFSSTDVRLLCDL
jgi:hypothetical protein